MQIKRIKPMKTCFWSKRLTLARLIITAMDMGYLIKLRGKDMLVFTLQDADTFVEEAFSYSELRSPNKRKDVLKTLIKWSNNGATASWY
ncbi:hypothetical protein FO014_14055 [Serratia rhizosphaerae]|uniref:Uncharacterized protein n=1 Tax=Serratia rhizosphaerae TaxID=2597702 RepID=A0ABX6GP70_9GAMM|nr:hypothetical protein FO014_14055 [Serratia rhizosphaerae]